MSNTMQDKHLITLPIEKDLVCLRCMSPKKLRFEVEFSLSKGTTANSFLFHDKHQSLNNSTAILVNPPGENFEEIFLHGIKKILDPKKTKLIIIVGHINPNRVALLRRLVKEFINIELICSNPAAKLLEVLWEQIKPSKNHQNSKKEIPHIPSIRLIKQEQKISFGNDYILNLIPAPTARWPGGLISFEETTGLLMSDKLFAAHICDSNWAEVNRISTEEERRHYFDCLMSPMVNQVNSIIEKVECLDIKVIAPGHGPAIETSWRSLLNDYQRWGDQQSKSSIKVLLLFASAYGNTASIADSLAKGISATGIKVESLNCEFTPLDQLVKSIQTADAYLIGSPTLGGHAPTPIVSALGTLLAEGDRTKPVGIFGSFGWSGEALELLENKLRDGGFQFGFNPIKIKFSPDAAMIKSLAETGTLFGRKLAKEKQRQENRLSGGIKASKSNPALLALGKVVGSLCVLTVRKHDNENPNSLSGAMIASWISQASFSPPGITIAVAKDRAVENLLHTGDYFALNILNQSNYQKLLKQFLKPFEPGANRLAGLNTENSPANQPVLPEALAWLEGCVKQRMECGDHWLIYAEILHGKVLNSNGMTAVHHRRTGSNY